VPDGIRTHVSGFAARCLASRPPTQDFRETVLIVAVPMSPLGNSCRLGSLPPNVTKRAGLTGRCAVTPKSPDQVTFNVFTTGDTSAGQPKPPVRGLTQVHQQVIYRPLIHTLGWLLLSLPSALASGFPTLPLGYSRDHGPPSTQDVATYKSGEVEPA
jgi:hypothetical protein